MTQWGFGSPVGDEQQHPCSQWPGKVQLSCYLFHEAFPFSPRIFSDYNRVSWQQVQTVPFIFHLSYAIVFFVNFFCHYSLYAAKWWVLRAQTMSKTMLRKGVHLYSYLHTYSWIEKKHFYNLHFWGLASRYSINNFTDNGDNQITQINSFLNFHLFWLVWVRNSQGIAFKAFPP